MFTVKQFMRNIPKIHFFWLILSAFVVGVDQLTKMLAVTHLKLHHPIPILPFLDLVLMYNNGAAFSLLHNAGGWQRYFFIMITCGVLIILWRWLWRLKAQETILGLSLALIIGGAIGNLIDRVITGEVIDFISVYYLTWRWPAFNIADSAISIGVGLLLIDTVLHKNAIQ